jgi:hypothetical protein
MLHRNMGNWALQFKATGSSAAFDKLPCAASRALLRVRQGRSGTTQGVKFGRKPKLTDHQQGDLVKTIEVSGASISRTPLR